MAAALSKTRVLILLMTHDKEIISGGGGGSSLSCTDPLVCLHIWIVRGRMGGVDCGTLSGDKGRGLRLGGVVITIACLSV